jgi:hypothetical protein
VNGRAFKVRYNSDVIYSAAEDECTAISNSTHPTVLVLASSTVPADGTELKVGPTRLLDQHEVLPWITLLTCRGYDEQSDTYRWRTAVRAVLVSVLNEDGR